MSFAIARAVVINAPEGMAAFPGHRFEGGECVWCHEQQNPETYEQYVAGWYATEYEGRVVESDGYQWEPEPTPRERWEWLRDTCLG